MPKTKMREYRTAREILPQTAVQTRKIESDFYVEGYAANYEKYPLIEMSDGKMIYEKFERGCFDNADMSDIIMQYDHSGRVFARKSNGTLIVNPDENGLFVAADLSKTDAARALYSDISAGMITKMSWGFLYGDYDFDTRQNCIIHKSIKKIYDVSAVPQPANDTTEIYARSADGCGGFTAGDCNGLIAEIIEKNKHDAQLFAQRKRLKIKTLTII